ncbi:MAG: division/cell wall cluster transcriptional repressor MraZ [Candidatus Campbellbacteria bacterium]|nr:division/cell wall cluster transcriptional repressor MraZ [Candidatus Campbellbacteria bacterium]
MLIGEYTHTLDSKKRISLPSKFRKELGKTVVATQGLDNCVAIYPLSAWRSTTEKLAEMSMGQSGSRDFSRFMLTGAKEVDVDSAGRILIPDFLKDFAGLKNKVVLAGVHNRVEIWNEKAWNEYKKRVQKQADVLAEKLGELGMI